MSKSPRVDRYKATAGLATERKTLNLHTCVADHVTQALLALLVTLNAATLYPIVSVQYILYTVLRLYY